MPETEKAITYHNILEGVTDLTIPDSALPSNLEIASRYFNAFYPDISGHIQIGDIVITQDQFDKALPLFMLHVQRIVVSNKDMTDKVEGMRRICTSPDLLTLRKVLFEQAVEEHMREEKLKYGN